jgi:hypothetical protein
MAANFPSTGEKMKTRTLAIAVILISSFVLASSAVRADQDDWYQGRRGHWVQQNKAWQFHDVDGDEYRQQGNAWGWSKHEERAEGGDQWFQGHRGHWIQRPNGWVFRDESNNVYRQYGNGWRWQHRVANN